MKYVIVLKKNSETYFFSIEYMTNGINRIFSRYFASAFFFDSKKSAFEEFKSIPDTELTSMIKKVGVVDVKDITQYKISLYQVTMEQTDTLVPLSFQPEL